MWPVIGTIVAAVLGGYVGFWLERWRYHFRQGELLVAIHAEIVAGMIRAGEQTTKKEIDYAVVNEDPFGIPDETDFVFISIKDNLSVLPRDAIHSIVRYYKLAAQTNALTRGLSDPIFQRQGRSEKAKYVASLMELLQEQDAVAQIALDDIEHTIAIRGEPRLHQYRPKRMNAATK